MFPGRVGDLVHLSQLFLILLKRNFSGASRNI